MAIVYGGHSTALNESTTSPLTVPITVTNTYQAGDLLIAQLLSREDSPTPVHGITTGGVSWTQIGTTQFLDIGTTGIAQSMWYRFATSGSESNASATCPTPNTMQCNIQWFRGVDTTTPLDGVTPIGGTAAAATTLQPNGGTGITTNTPNAVVCAAVSTPDDNSIDMSVANGFQDRTPILSAVNTDWAQSFADITVASPGNQTACTFRQVTLGADEWAWHLFVLREIQVPLMESPIVIDQAVGRSYSY
jgi:hypothetical protein